MSDIEKLKLILTEFGIGFDLYTDERPDTESKLLTIPAPTKIVGYDIICNEGESKIEGYLGFYARFEFDTKGKFKQMVIGE